MSAWDHIFKVEINFMIDNFLYHQKKKEAVTIAEEEANAGLIATIADALETCEAISGGRAAEVMGMMTHLFTCKKICRRYGLMKEVIQSGVLTLKLKDGFESQAHELRLEVRKLQALLNKKGYRVDADGLFGRGTENAVKDYQRFHGLVADGIVGPATWKLLNKTPPDDLITSFRGSYQWVHKLEGHAGEPYWPGGASGITLDPGIDLGHASEITVQTAYKDILMPDKYKAVKEVLGIRGRAAKKALDDSQVLKTIVITKTHASAIFKYAAAVYWEAIVRRFPTLKDPDTPAVIHTVMLSLSYNRGAGNRRLRVLERPLAEKRWEEVAVMIGDMQQDHKLRGIRRRRRLEADYIRSWL